MGEFDFEKLDREVDDLLADVKGLLDEPEEDEAELDDLEEDETEPEDAEDDAESGEAEDAVSDDRTIIFKPLTAYEQSKAEYQTAKRAEYERARAQERQNRLAEQQRREAEEDRVLRQMEDRRKKAVHMFLVGNLFIRRFEFFDGTRDFGENKLYLY